MNNWNDDKVFAGWDTPLEVLAICRRAEQLRGADGAKSLLIELPRLTMTPIK